MLKLVHNSDAKEKGFEEMRECFPEYFRESAHLSLESAWKDFARNGNIAPDQFGFASLASLMDPKS